MTRTISAPAGATNKSGQRLGRKGADTRARAIEVLEQLLTESKGVEPTAAAVARAAGLSAPAFYLYFKDVGEAVLALVEQLEERFRPVVALMEVPWPRDALFVRAEAFVRAYFDYWSANAPLLRARNRLADQGDQRFVRLRVASIEALALALRLKIGEPPVAGGLPCSANAMSTVLITAMERLATVSFLGIYPGAPANQDDIVAALANMLAVAMLEGKG